MPTSSNVRMDASEAAAVLARARQGDSDAFRVLVERHSRNAFRLAHRLTGNEQDAEDVVQESFIRAYRQLGRFESRANFGTWLYRIVANCSVDLIRVRQSRRDQSRAESLDEAAGIASNAAPGPERLARSAEIERHVATASVAIEPSRASSVHPPALRRTIDRRDWQDAGSGHERDQTQRVPCSPQAAGCPRVTAE